MSFVEQEDILKLLKIFWAKFSKNFPKKNFLHEKFPRISFEESMLKYATDKPDLRNPLEIFDLTSIFERDDVKFEIFKKLVKSGSIVRAIVTKNTHTKPRSFFWQSW